MERWLLGMNSLTTLARELGVSRKTLSQRFSRIIKINRIKLKPLFKNLILVIDGTAISSDRILLVVYELLSDQPLTWVFVSRECFYGWFRLLSNIKKKYQATAIVSDGQKGLIKAINMLFPGIPHQRCIAHIVRRACAWLTLRPKTEAGIELRQHILKLKNIKSIKEAMVWKNYFVVWEEKYYEFLKEKSVNFLTGKTWFTHRKVRSVRSLIKNALLDMFWYTNNSNIPNTTNTVEGGINSPLSELLRRHRGITRKQKEALVTRFLYSRRRTRLSTRKVT